MLGKIAAGPTVCCEIAIACTIAWNIHCIIARWVWLHLDLRESRCGIALMDQLASQGIFRSSFNLSTLIISLFVSSLPQDDKINCYLHYKRNAQHFKHASLNITLTKVFMKQIVFQTIILVSHNINVKDLKSTKIAR